MGRDFIILSVGLVFILVSVFVGGVDILPAFVGYALIAFAAHSLTQYAPAFRFTRNLALPMIVYSLFATFSPGAISPTLLAVESVLTIVLVCLLLGAVIRFTDSRERPDLAEHGVLYRRIYVGIAVVAFLFRLAAFVQPEAAAPFLSVMMLGTIVILALIIRLLYAVKQDLAVDSVAIRG